VRRIAPVAARSLECTEARRIDRPARRRLNGFAPCRLDLGLARLLPIACALAGLLLASVTRAAPATGKSASSPTTAGKLTSTVPAAAGKGIGSATPADGVSASGASSAAASTRTVEVRLALSTPAAQGLSEARVRRLLEIELEESAVLAPGVSGPLGDHVAYVWIDQQTAAQILVEVRTGERSVARRELRVAGVGGDVAARLVAIAASEMIRAQLQPIPPPRRAPQPHRPTTAEIEIAARLQPTLTITPSAVGAYLPSANDALGGVGLTVGFRFKGVGEALFARWLTGAGQGATMRWFEVGALADERVWLGPALRLAFGATATLASVHLVGARVIDADPTARDAWSARAAATLGIEARVSPAAWISVSLEPSVILRPVRNETPARRGALEGAWLGLNVALPFEWPQRPVIATTAATAPAAN
jgi:hypothetical protein